MTAPSTTPPLGRLHTPLTDQVTDHIRLEITQGALPPGSRLEERELADRLAVSRVPVRESLQRLETEGFVTRLPRRGVVVSTMTSQDLRNIFDVREALEVQAVRLAALRATPDQIEQMRRVLSRAREALPAGDVPTFNAMNESFTRRYWRRSRRGMSIGRGGLAAEHVRTSRTLASDVLFREDAPAP